MYVNDYEQTNVWQKYWTALVKICRIHSVTSARRSHRWFLRQMWARLYLIFLTGALTAHYLYGMKINRQRCWDLLCLHLCPYNVIHLICSCYHLFVNVIGRMPHIGLRVPAVCRKIFITFRVILFTFYDIL